MILNTYPLDEFLIIFRVAMTISRSTQCEAFNFKVETKICLPFDGVREILFNILVNAVLIMFVSGSTSSSCCCLLNSRSGSGRYSWRRRNCCVIIYKGNPSSRTRAFSSKISVFNRLIVWNFSDCYPECRVCSIE